MSYSTYAEHVHSANAECYAILCETFVTVMGKFLRFARLHGYKPVAQKQQPLTRHYNSWLKLQKQIRPKWQALLTSWRSVLSTVSCFLGPGLTKSVSMWREKQAKSNESWLRSGLSQTGSIPSFHLGGGRLGSNQSTLPGATFTAGLRRRS